MPRSTQLFTSIAPFLLRFLVLIFSFLHQALPVCLSLHNCRTLTLQPGQVLLALKAGDLYLVHLKVQGGSLQVPASDLLHAHCVAIRTSSVAESSLQTAACGSLPALPGEWTPRAAGLQSRVVRQSVPLSPTKQHPSPTLLVWANLCGHDNRPSLHVLPVCVVSINSGILPPVGGKSVCTRRPVLQRREGGPIARALGQRQSHTPIKKWVIKLQMPP